MNFKIGWFQAWSEYHSKETWRYRQLWWSDFEIEIRSPSFDSREDRSPDQVNLQCVYYGLFNITCDPFWFNIKNRWSWTTLSTKKIISATISWCITCSRSLPSSIPFTISNKSKHHKWYQSQQTNHKECFWRKICRLIR